MTKTGARAFVGQEGEPRHAAIDAALEYLAARYRHQPSLDEVARVAGMSPYHFQRTFRAWTGVTPKRFIQFLQLGEAKSLLIQEHSLMTTAFEIGLSGTSRLHDLFISCEAVTPGEFKNRGRGLAIWYGVHDSPFGRAVIAVTDRGVCWLGFVEARCDEQTVRELNGDWPGARVVHDPARTKPLAAQIFARARGARNSAPLRLDLRGTNFQIKVWEALLRIPFGRLATYQDVAVAAGTPAAARAVGGAVGANPISLVILAMEQTHHASS
jgi:AraC family transcriptional regulator of adaptative response/methylated-DNA-[protein]-cysteine methyltransferase